MLYAVACKPSDTYIQTAIASTQEKQITPIKVITIEPTITPSANRIFRDESDIRIDLFGDYPDTECEETEQGWRCHRGIGQPEEIAIFGLDFISDPGKIEVYQVIYTSPIGLNSDGIFESIESIKTILQDKLTADLVIEWILDEGIKKAAEDEDEYPIFEINDVYVWVNINEVWFDYSLCSGDQCK